MSRDVKILRKAIAQIDVHIGEQEARVKALENESDAVKRELHQVDADQQRKAEECRRRCERRAAERAGGQREKLLLRRAGEIQRSKRRINARVLKGLRKRRRALAREVEDAIERQHLGASGGGRRRSTRRKRRRSTRRKRRRSTRRKRRRRSTRRKRRL